MKLSSGLLILLLLPLSAFAKAAARPAIIDNQPSTELFEIELPEAVTTMMYTSAPQQFSGTMVLYGGLGAKSAAFGIGASLGHIANKALKENIEPFAFQNPLYFHDEKTSAERLLLIGKYRNLDSQLEWMAQTLRIARAKAVNFGRLVLGGRSTGGALLLEAYHQYLALGTYADIFAYVDDILIMGTVDPRALEIWHATERTFLEAQNKLFDKLAFDAEPTIFATMKHLAQTVIVPTTRKVARITFVVGTNDELNSAQAQLDVAKTFSRLHAGLPVQVIVTDTHHNPAASIRYEKNGESLRVRTMARLSPILENIFNGRHGDETGFRVQINPEVEPCELLLVEGVKVDNAK